MKITILSDSFPPQNRGGAGQIAFNLAGKFISLGKEVSVITTVQKPELAGVSSENGMRVFRIYSNYNVRWRAWLGIYNPQTVPEVKKILRELRPDVVHAHNIHFYLSYASLAVARKYSQFVFLTAHDVQMFTYTKFWPKEKDCNRINYRVGFFENIRLAGVRSNPFRELLIKWYIRSCNKIFTVSRALSDALAQNGIRGTIPVNNGLDSDERIFVPAAEIEAWKKENGLTGAQILFLPGRIDYAKGPYNVIEILGAIRLVAPNTVLLLVGATGEDQQKLMAYASEYGVSDAVRIEGWRDEHYISLAYQAADLVLCPSIIFDSFPTVNIEAARFKKTVVATCFGGGKEFVVDGQTGYIVNPYRADDLREKIIDLLAHPERARAFGLAAHERLKKDFSLTQQAETLLRYYEMGG